MAEVTLDLRDRPRAEAYDTLQEHVDAVLEGIDDEIAEMATIACLVHNAFGHLWTGFYRVVEPHTLLRVGPYQGTLGCLEIAFGRGVCGAAATQRRTMVVDDVNEFPGHIACDGRSLSEIVLPVIDAEGRLIAVFDVDSEHRATFNDDDRVGLERILKRFARRPSVSSVSSASSATEAPVAEVTAAAVQ